MRKEDLVWRLSKRPCRPFRLHLADGASYDVRHPEFAVIGDRSLAFIFVGAADDRAVAIDDYYTLVLHHIVRLEPLGESSVTAG